MSALFSRQDIIERDVIDIRIDGYGYTGEGYARLSDGWLSVRGALPGEYVRVRLQHNQRLQSRRYFAQIVEVLEPSEHRRDPHCSEASTCRGCQLRHLTVAEELSFKARNIAEVIEKYAHLPVGEQPPIKLISPMPLARGDAFRVRTTLNYRHRNNQPELGLVRPGYDSLVSMSQCPAITTATQRIVTIVEEIVSTQPHLPPDRDHAMLSGGNYFVDTIRVMAPHHGHGFIEIVLGAPMDGKTEQIDLEHILDDSAMAALLGQLDRGVPDNVGLAVKFNEQRHYWRKNIKTMTIPVCGLALQISLDDWFHATLVPAEVNYDAVLELLEPAGQERLLDVGCGVGTISLLCSPKIYESVGIDRNLSSIEFARLNAVNHGVENATFIAGAWESGLRKLALKQERFNCAVINPMREPLGARALSYLQMLGVERLIYLGPSAVSAAKDIGELRNMGWAVNYLASSNLHPATYHTMLVARLSRVS